MPNISKNPKWTKEAREIKTTASRFRPSNSMTLAKKQKISRELVLEHRKEMKNENEAND